MTGSASSGGFGRRRTHSVAAMDDFKRVAILRWVWPWRDEIVHQRRTKRWTSRYTRRVLKQWERWEGRNLPISLLSLDDYWTVASKES